MNRRPPLGRGDRRSRRQGIPRQEHLGNRFRPRCLRSSRRRAYICGEETGFLESLEGKRGNPRSSAVPGVRGAFSKVRRSSTTVETLANVPSLSLNGAACSWSWARPRTGGTRILVSGAVMKLGIYELRSVSPARAHIRARRRPEARPHSKAVIPEACLPHPPKPMRSI